jgi:hypothetical protein
MVVFNYEAYNNVIKAVFFLILAIIGGWTGETLGCKAQKLLTENMLVKHGTIFMIIYFAIDISNNENKKPLDLLKLTSLIYIMYLLFTKMNIYSTIVVFIILGVIYVLINQINYLKNNNGEEKEIKRYTDLNNILKGILPIIIIVSFVFYLIKQRKDNAKNWSTIKFLFGNTKCKNN